MGQSIASRAFTVLWACCAMKLITPSFVACPRTSLKIIPRGYARTVKVGTTFVTACRFTKIYYAETISNIVYDDNAIDVRWEVPHIFYEEEMLNKVFSIDSRYSIYNYIILGTCCSPNSNVYYFRICNNLLN